MKKQFLLVVLPLLFVAPGSAFALFGFGAHGGLDVVSVDADSASFTPLR